MSLNPTTVRILAKVRNARHHLHTFGSEHASYFNPPPFEISVREDDEKGERQWFLKSMKPVPDSLESIAADVVQNLRSALDQVAYQLVIASRSGVEPGWKVYFPITRGPDEHLSPRGILLKGIGQPEAAAIDAIEPWKGGNGHRLWQLNQLANHDKHRSLLKVGPRSAVNLAPFFEAHLRDRLMEMFGPNVPRWPSLYIANSALDLVKEGDGLYGQPLGLPGKDVKSQFQFYLAIDPSVIGEAVIAMDLLGEITVAVENVVLGLDRFLL